MRPSDIPGPQVASEPVFGVVCNLDGVSFVIERNRGERRTKDLFLGDAHFIVRTGEQHGCDPVAAFGCLSPRAALDHRCAVFFGDVAVTADLVVMPGVNQRADHRGWVEGMPHGNTLHLLGETFGECVIDR